MFNRITLRDIVDYKRQCIQSLKLKPATINRRLVSLRSMCRVATELGKMKANPVEKVKLLPLQALAPKGLSKQELRRLLKEVELRGNLRDQLIIELMCGAGLRVSELANMEVDDVHLSERKGFVNVRYAKGGKTRKVPLNQAIRSLMREHLEQSKPDERVFVGQRGDLTNIAFNKVVEVYASKAQIKCSPHTLRHTFAYNYLEKNNGDLVGLGTLLGHSNINTTAIYTQHRLEDLQERVEGVLE